MSITLTSDELHQWAVDCDPDDPQRVLAEQPEYATTMSGEEKDSVDDEIARRQLEYDPTVEIPDAFIVLKVLLDHGFHPAFESNGVVSGMNAFEALKFEKAAFGRQ